MDGKKETSNIFLKQKAAKDLGMIVRVIKLKHIYKNIINYKYVYRAKLIFRIRDIVTTTLY
jgi:hypothetical protein